jgi:hypothetical protein
MMGDLAEFYKGIIMSSTAIETQKKAFLTDLESTDAEIVKLKNTIGQLEVKGHQLRGAIYALDLALAAVAAPTETVLPIEQAIEDAKAAVDASEKA